MTRNELLTRLHDQAMDVIGEALISLQDATAEVGEIPRRFDDWHEDHGSGLWWDVEHTDDEIQEEPEYIGRPGDNDWPWNEEDEPHLLWIPLPKLARVKP